MTVLVGILNKQAISVAADSAVTIGGGVKVYNTANKIFNLAKGRPVGIAIYGNAALNGCVPWEVVIKMYRKHIGNKKFSKLSDYSSHFIKYVYDFSHKYISEADALNVLKGNIMRFWCDDITRGLREADIYDAPIAELALPILKNRLTELTTNLKKNKILDIYKAVKIDIFLDSIRDVLDVIKKQITHNGGAWDEFQSLVQECIFRFFTTNTLRNPNTSGVALFGYGEDEIYPSLQEFIIFNIVLGVQRIEKKTDKVIDETNSAVIYPMAQRDVIETFIEGVSHRIRDTFIDATVKTIKATINQVSHLIEPYNLSLASNIKMLDYTGIVAQYRNTINEIINRDQVSPLMQTIVSMGKEDISDLAENLVYMTSMKRHVSPFAETVGGPIDVAVISKGDGFIWMKRKHYFLPELNSDFFDTKR